MDENGGRVDVPTGWKTPAEGAATSVLLAASPSVEGVTGRYFEDVAEVTSLRQPGDDSPLGVEAYALDPDQAERLWTESMRLIDL